MNLDLLKKRIEESGLKQIFIAEQLGIDRASLYNKLNGKSEFTMKEIVNLSRVLHIDDKEKLHIFFPKKSN